MFQNNNYVKTNLLVQLCVFSLQFFSSGLAQRGEDDEGFDGFLIKDIKKEITRAKRLVGIVI